MNSLESAALDRAAISDPEWRRTRREAALTAYRELPMPSESEELWRYVDLDFDLDDFGMAAEPGAIEEVDAVASDATQQVTVVDGTAASHPVETDRTWIGSLADGLVHRSEVLQRASVVEIAGAPDKFAVAHDAFGGDGALIHVGRGAAAPTVLVHLHSATSQTVSFPSVVVVAEEAATASVVVDITSPEETTAIVVPHVTVVAGAGSNVKLSTIQRLGRRGRSIARSRAVLGRDATLTFAEAGLGGSLSRLHLTVDLEGRGSSAEVIGAYFGDRDQVLDYRYFMHHAGLNTNSNMFLKGAVEDEALSVFTGMIRIDESAQRTDAFQTNRNLILSDGAAAQSVPNLEILANDVRCGHGSTVGPLDEEQRYYLTSRGLPKDRADRLQVRGFFEEALARFPHQAAAGSLREWINAKFIAAQEEGRI